tara:strand:+ start:659 stop:793 length:135 start_codon:yes stop_codon:yes gene_type:complete
VLLEGAICGEQGKTDDHVSSGRIVLRLFPAQNCPSTLNGYKILK